MSLKYLYGKSAPTEFLQPIQGEKIGQIPNWLNGNFYRNGPGIYEIGDTKYNHFFDGLAILQKYEIKNGEVSYQSQFIRSDTYKTNMAANRIVVSEFGTMGFPDPCKSIFGRFMSLFETKQMTDNTSVNIFPVHDQLFAATETNLVNRIDPETLDRIENINLTEVVAVNGATAHPHWDNDGTLHNLASLFREKGGPHYAIIHVAPHDENQHAFQKAKIAAKIPSRWKLKPAYNHSFGMSENYYIVYETPLVINAPKILLSSLLHKSYNEAMHWEENQMTIIHVIDRKSGQLHGKYHTDAMFCFHFINCYEENGHLIIDSACYDDGTIVCDASISKLTSENQYHVLPPALPRRLILPLAAAAALDVDKISNGENLITLKETLATAVFDHSLKSIYCKHELLSALPIEMPTINYAQFNTKPYRYFYGIQFLNQDNKIIKVDSHTKTEHCWKEANCYPTEPIFVAQPNAVHEDDGVILASVITIHEESRGQFLLILNAKDFQELGRVLFPTASVPMGFHGNFIRSK